jgi:hypothetical protein
MLVSCKTTADETVEAPPCTDQRRSLPRRRRHHGWYVDAYSENAAQPGGWMKRLDTFLRVSLFALAILLMAGAYMRREYFGLLISPFMIAVLYVPFSTNRREIKPITRYVIYFFLLVAFFVIWSSDRISAT